MPKDPLQLSPPPPVSCSHNYVQEPVFVEPAPTSTDFLFIGLRTRQRKQLFFIQSPASAKRKILSSQRNGMKVKLMQQSLESISRFGGRVVGHQLRVTWFDYSFLLKSSFWIPLIRTSQLMLYKTHSHILYKVRCKLTLTAWWVFFSNLSMKTSHYILLGIITLGKRIKWKIKLS